LWASQINSSCEDNRSCLNCVDFGSWRSLGIIRESVQASSSERNYRSLHQGESWCQTLGTFVGERGPLSRESVVWNRVRLLLPGWGISIKLVLAKAEKGSPTSSSFPTFLSGIYPGLLGCPPVHAKYYRCKLYNFTSRIGCGVVFIADSLVV